MKLHIFNKHHQTARFDLLAEDDAILLIEDAVYMASSLESPLPADRCFHVLLEDAQLRGIANNLQQGSKPVTREQFVTLCTQYAAVTSW